MDHFDHHPAGYKCVAPIVANAFILEGFGDDAHTSVVVFEQPAKGFHDDGGVVGDFVLGVDLGGGRLRVVPAHDDDRFGADHRRSTGKPACLVR